MGSQKNLDMHSNEHSEQAYWSYEITIFFLCIGMDIGTKIQKLFRKKEEKKAHLHWQKPKSQKPGFFVVPFTLPEKTHNFSVFGQEKCMRENPRIS